MTCIGVSPAAAGRGCWSCCWASSNDAAMLCSSCLLASIALQLLFIAAASPMGPQLSCKPLQGLHLCCCCCAAVLQQPARARCRSNDELVQLVDTFSCMSAEKRLRGQRSRTCARHTEGASRSSSLMKHIYAQLCKGGTKWLHRWLLHARVSWHCRQNVLPPLAEPVLPHLISTRGQLTGLDAPGSMDCSSPQHCCATPHTHQCSMCLCFVQGLCTHVYNMCSA
jgi:hypothetical protein